MTDYDDDTESLPAPAPVDRFADALALLTTMRNAKEIEVALKRLRRLERDIAAAEAKLAAVTTKAEQTAAALAEREAASDARAAALDTREAEVEDQIREAHDHLRAYHSEIRQADRSLRYRVLASADLLHGYNPTLQELPDWPEIQRTIGLSVDPPLAPPADHQEVRNVRHDWAGSVFSPDSTVTRTITVNE
jgi:septal ring factor EnvC (AmiA/AmiB activator)